MRIPCIPVWIKAMLTAVILVLLVKTFAFTSCTIPSTGMENSLYQGERVLVNKWSYGFRVPFSNLCDSRLFGLVPDDHLIGKAWRIWFSSRKGRIFQRVQ